MNSLLRTICLFGGLSAGAFLANGESMALHIPFTFTAGSKTMPAGDYTVDQTTDRVLMIRGDVPGLTASIIATPGIAGLGPAAPDGAYKARASFDWSSGAAVLSAISWDGRTVFLIRPEKHASVVQTSLPEHALSHH